MLELEIPDRYFLLHRTEKEERRCCKEEGSKERRKY
jgi:hypothetical protein